MSEGRPEDIRRIGDRADEIDVAEATRRRVVMVCVVAMIVALPAMLVWRLVERHYAEQAARPRDFALVREVVRERVGVLWETESRTEAERLLGPPTRVVHTNREMGRWERGREGQAGWLRWLKWVDPQDENVWVAALIDESDNNRICRWEGEGW